MNPAHHRSIGRFAWPAALLAATLAGGCDRAAPPAATPPPPLEVQDEAVGHYCGMRLVDHEGPKGQVHLASRPAPVWFSSVRDALAFMRLPEEPRDIVAVWVNDMGRARRWEQPEPGTWVEARQAYYVIESDMQGGMGAPEAVPFSDATAAEAFRTAHRGRVVRLDQIPDSYVLGPVRLPDAASAPAAAALPAHAASR